LVQVFFSDLFLFFLLQVSGHISQP